MDSEIQDNFLRIYKNDYSDDGYFLDESYNDEQMYYIVDKSGYEFSDQRRNDFKNFSDLLRRKKIKVLKKPSLLGWFYGSSINDDLSYTFDQYEKKLDSMRDKERRKNIRDKTRRGKMEDRPEKRESPSKPVEITPEIPEAPKIDPKIQIRKDFKFVYEKYFKNEISYDYKKDVDQKFFMKMKNNPLDKYHSIENFKVFQELLSTNEIRILKEPNPFHWFRESLHEEDDMKYTLKVYLQKVEEIQRQRREQKKLKLPEPEEIVDTTPSNVKSFQKTYPKMFNVYERFVMEDKFERDNFFDYFFEEKKYTNQQMFYFIIEETREKYNSEKEKYNQKVRIFPHLSDSEKSQVKEMGKNLDKFLLNFKPIVKKYDAEKRERDEKFKKKLLASEEQKLAEQKLKIQLEENRNLQLANEQIEDLEYKIRDAESRYSMNKAKLRKLDFKVQKLEKLKDQKSLLEEKLKSKNLKISERKKIIELRSKINKSLDSLESLREQRMKLFSQMKDLTTFEQERIMRERELETLKKLNETSIRTKNANLRSLELEKKREEIRIFEEERYQEQKRQEEELKQLKIVFLKEKKLANKRIDQLKWESKSKNIKLQNIKKLNLDLEEQKKNLQKILSEKQTSLRDKQEQIERQKIKNLESQKEKVESQQLFSDSLKRDVDDLEFQKQILSEISDNNKKILNNTKREISSRQKEIVKTISLNMETARQNAADIYAKEAKMKLDVFQTLSEVKNQAALKTDVENALEDLKDSILRKEAVESFLSDAIDSISNNEISEIENYNSYLESEIEFKKKLADKNLSLADKQEYLNDEKEDLIERLEKVKSQKLKKIYQTREAAIEQQMRILLIEGADELKNELFSLKYDIQNLETQKEISERKEDLAKFQSDNAKRELNLRKQEIELLKNIRLQVIETQRINLRNETKLAIHDMVIAAEKNVRDSEVREKLDEILDDVEIREISKSSKEKLNSIIDKIESKEIYDSAQQTLNVILDKIELHENIDEYKKTLNSILDQIEDTQIRTEVETTLDEILDDIEFDDFDFLEDDDLDILLKSVKKHISGEEKIEKFLPKIREEDAKLKMDENIEMKERNRQDAPDDTGDLGETSFAEFDNYYFFIDNIENPEMRNKVKIILENEDGFDKHKPEKMKNAYTKSINQLWQSDQLDTNFWDGNIILDEKAKFLYEQKVNNLNTALVDYDIHIDPTDPKVRTFLDIRLIETTSEKRGEINGYKFNGEKIISRNISRNFFFNYLKKPAACQKFIDDIKEIINKSAKSQIAAESYFDGKSVKDCAMEYIGELREEQSYQMEIARNGKEMKQALRDGNEMEEEIKKIKKNMPVKIRLKIFRRTLSWRITKLLRYLWKHKKAVAGITFTLFSLAIGVALNQLGVIEVVNHLKKAANNVKQYANDVHDMGKRIIHNVQALYGLPGKVMGVALILIGVFLRILYFATRMTGTASSGWVFGIFGALIEISMFFSGNIETINEKAAEILEETGNTIEDVGIRAQKTIAKNMPRWYYDKPPEERTILQHVEAAAANLTFKVAKGTQYTGKKVQEAGEIMSQTLFYMQALLVIMLALFILSFIRNNFLK